MDQALRLYLVQFFERKNKSVDYGEVFRLWKYFEPEVNYKEVQKELGQIIEGVNDYPLMKEEKFLELSKNYLRKPPVNYNDFPPLGEPKTTILRIPPNPNSAPTMANLKLLSVHLMYQKIQL